jgi:hypothetical protein
MLHETAGRGEGERRRLLLPLHRHSPVVSGRHVILQLFPRSRFITLGSFPWRIGCGAVAVALTSGRTPRRLLHGQVRGRGADRPWTGELLLRDAGHIQERVAALLPKCCNCCIPVS